MKSYAEHLLDRAEAAEAEVKRLRHALLDAGCAIAYWIEQSSANGADAGALLNRAEDAEADYRLMEAAEQNRSEQLAAAEARIAAALAVVNSRWNGYRDDDAVRSAIRRALEGTE